MLESALDVPFGVAGGANADALVAVADETDQVGRVGEAAFDRLEGRLILGRIAAQGQDVLEPELEDFVEEVAEHLCVEPTQVRCGIDSMPCFSRIRWTIARGRGARAAAGAVGDGDERRVERFEPRTVSAKSVSIASSFFGGKNSNEIVGAGRS